MTFINSVPLQSFAKRYHCQTLLIAMCVICACSDNANMVGSKSRSQGSSAGQANVSAGTGGIVNASGAGGAASSGGSAGALTTNGGNANAGAAQGGVGGTTGSSSPAAGQAGFVGRTCDDIKADYAAELTKAKRCDYGQVDVCSATILDTPDCGCITNVSTQASLVKLNELQDEWVEHFCTQSGCPRECVEPAGRCEHPQGQTVGHCSN